jgi:ADP-heptose:LPS heptosyltransferase
MTRTIVMIHPGSLGDVLLAVPAMKRLQASFAEHRSLLVATESVGRMLHGVELIDACLSIEGAAVAGLFAGSVPKSGELASWLKQCDYAVAWMDDKEGTLAMALRGSGAREVRIQSPFSAELKARHQGDRFLETLRGSSTGPSDDTSLPMPGYLIEEGRVYLDRLGISAGQLLVLVHPGSGSRQKCLGPEILAQVLERLRQAGTHPLVIEGPADRETVAELLVLMPVKPTVLRELPLTLLAGVLTQAWLYVGHDSGITHLSSLLGVPTVAVFGPTDSERWRPRGGHVAVLQGAPCMCGSWEMVKACVEKPCLSVSAEALIALCLMHQADSATSRNLS